MMQGRFYFISDEFYAVHDKDNKLMQNRERIDGANHGRPCFYAFQDERTPGIYWCVPLSSKIEKYKRIYESKLERQRMKGVAKPKCNTICFGEVMGQPRAFLVQNMFPIIEKFISSVYMDRNTKTPVTIEPGTERQVVNKAKEVLRLVFRGYSNIVFSDIVKTYNDLCGELHEGDT